ncbi:MAG: adenylate/guanylate cyclase domain-containing protein, partial [Candidatus Muirbacterium halophilum]|nr:adenylate/guanylate cyclase domain-containing protein [Candidatus Muirbacterium halophilum]
YIFNIIKKEYFSPFIKIYDLFKNILTMPENSGKFIIAFIIILLTNVILAFFLILRKSGGETNLKVKTEYAQKAKKMEELLSNMREDMSNRKVKFSSVLLRYRELIGSLERDTIVNLIFNILSKSAYCMKISIFIVDESSDDIFMLARHGDIVDKNLKIKKDSKDIIAYSVRESKLFSIWNEDKLIQNLFKNSELKCKLVTPILKEKVSGVIVVEEFQEVVDEDGKRKEYVMDDEARLLITTTASLAAIAFDKAQLFEMTKDELQSEKKFSAKQLQEKKQLRNSFQRYTSPAVVEELLKNPDMLKLGGKKAELTVLFSDIVGFTTYSEKYQPEKVVSILNEYLTAMTDVIMDHNGTLDKFVGDEIMAIWGAPVHHKEHAQLAVKCGFAMLAKLDELVLKWKKDGVEPFNIGIGINTGDMIVGNMGSPKRMDYTVIGDAVNTGARIESLTRQFKTSFIVSENTYERVKDFVEAELLGKVTVKGKSIQIKVYKLVKLK